MNDERERILALRIEARRLHHVSIHSLVIGADERELFRFAELNFAQCLCIDAREVTQLAAFQGERIEFRWRLERGQRKNDLAFADGKGVDVSRARQHRRLARLHIDRPQRVLTEIVGGCVEHLAVVRKLDRIDRAIPGLGQCAALAALRVLDHDMETVGFEARAFHRTPRELRPIAREHWLRVPGEIIGGEIARFAAIDRHFIQIEVGRPRFRLALDARREHDLRAVRRERVLGGIAERLGRHIGVQRSGQ